MDKRLNQIQTGTLTESRLNDDFVYWLKTKGLNYLLVVLLIGCGVMGYQWYQRVQNQRRGEAWARLEAAGTPQDLVEVVSEHGSIGSLAIIARVRAADTYVGSVIRGVRYDRDPTSPEAAVTPELRTQWFDEADRLYAEAAAAASEPGAALALRPVAAHALLGRAAIAESRGDGAKAKEYLEAVVALAGTDFPEVASQARDRLANVDVVALGTELPPRSALPVTQPAPGAAPGAGLLPGGGLAPGAPLPVPDQNTGIPLNGGQIPGSAAPAAPVPATPVPAKPPAGAPAAPPAAPAAPPAAPPAGP